MKKLFPLAIMAISLTVFAKSHSHGEKCGHEKVKHGKHFDWVNGNKYEFQKGDKVVFHGFVKGHDAVRTIAAQEHDHGHQHVHGAADCEHEKVVHANHVDYLHDGHFHAEHVDHIDEHGILGE